MRIENVELTNMRTFVSASYKVPKGLSLVTGQNGTGKSSLLGIAAAWILWGQTPGRTQDFLVRHGERDMAGSLLFSSNGHTYKVSRKFKLNLNGKGGVTQLLFTGDSDYTGATVRETQARINDIAGNFEVWQMTAYVSQREGAGQFLEANAYDRKGILREIIAGVGDWDQWEGLAKKWVRHYETKIAELNGATPVLEELAEPLDSVTQTLEAARQQAETISRDQGVAETNRESCNAALERGREVIAQWNKWDGDIKVLEEKISTAQEQIERIDSNVEDLQKHSEQLDRINADYDAHQEKIAARQAEIGKVRAENESIRETQVEIETEYQLAIRQWQGEVEQFHKRGAAKENELLSEIKAAESVGAAIEELESSVCATCKQPLTGERRDELEKIIAEGVDWEGSIVSARENIAVLKDELPPVRPADKTMPALYEVPSELGQDERIIELRTKAMNAAELIEKQEELKLELERQITTNESYILAIQRTAQFEAVARPEPDYLEKLLESAQLATESLKLVNEGLATANSNVRLGEQAVAQATKAKNDLSANRTSLGEHKTDLYEWETVVQMCGTNGIRQLIIDQALAQLEPACNRWLNIIAPGFEIAFSTQTDTDRETFEEGVILPSGAIQPWSELSGAQSVAVALAVRLGLAEVGGAAQGIHYETLYLDEADAWLTGDYQQQFMDMLALIADTGIDVVAITHIEAVKEMVDQQVEVVATGDGSSRLK